MLMHEKTCETPISNILMSILYIYYKDMNIRNEFRSSEVHVGMNSHSFVQSDCHLNQKNEIHF